MLKRRAPKPRQVVVSQRALQLFLELQTHERGSERWWALHDTLHAELGARFHQWPLDRNVGGPWWDALEAAAAAERKQGEFAAAK
jgi:hypothetical protein